MMISGSRVPRGPYRRDLQLWISDMILMAVDWFGTLFGGKRSSSQVMAYRAPSSERMAVWEEVVKEVKTMDLSGGVLDEPKQVTGMIWL